MKRGLGIKVLLGCFLCLAVTVGGCYINVGCCGWPQVKYERVVYLSAPMAFGRSFEAETHNGSITITGGDIADCNVTATIIGRAMSTEDAKKIAEETKIKLEPFGNKLVARIKRPVFATNQSVSVRFDVKLPSKANLELETHNGKIRITGISGDVDGTTHNGRIVCEEVSGDVKLKTHNGKVNVVYAKSSAAVCEVSLITHNGNIEFTAPPSFSAKADIRTHNGSIRTELAITVVGKFSKSKLAGKIGAGEGTLYLETHNGSIKINRQD